MKFLSFLLTASLLFLGCKKVATTTPSISYLTFEVSKHFYHYTDINGQDSSCMSNTAAFNSYVTDESSPFFGILGHIVFYDSSLKIKVNDSLMQCLECIKNGVETMHSYIINFPDIDSPIHWQLFGGKYFKDYSLTYPAPFPYNNITFPDTLHYLQGFTLPCSFTNADSVSLHFLCNYGKTITLAGTVNSINIAPNTFANVQDSAFNMMVEVYNQHTELVNGNHYIFRKANYVAAKTVIVP